MRTSVTTSLAMVGALLLAPQQLQAQTLFNVDFNSAGNYGWDFEFPEKCQTYPNWGSCGSARWALQHLPTGGWNGTGGARLVARAGYSQGSIGWVDRSDLVAWNQGDHFYVRFRIRFDSTMRWDGAGSQQNKMFIWGAGEHNGLNHRVMLHQEKDHPTSPCADLPAATSNANFGTIAVKRNIQQFCTPPAAITYDQWYHVQFYVKSGATADSQDAELKLWVNNSNFAAPTSQRIGGFNLAVLGHWDQGFQFGGFWTDAVSRDSSWIVDDFQIGLSFDPSWAGASPEAPTSLTAR